MDDGGSSDTGSPAPRLLPGGRVEGVVDGAGGVERSWTAAATGRTEPVPPGSGGGHSPRLVSGRGVSGLSQDKNAAAQLVGPEGPSLGCRACPAGQSPAQPLSFVWTIITVENDVAQKIEQAQARAIKEVLQWLASQPHRSRSKS